MKIKSHFLSPALLAVSTLTVLSVSLAHAQTAPKQSTAQPAAESVAPYRSAFEGYQPYTEEKIANWKAANEKVDVIGGWREYARQAQQVPNTPTNTPANPPAETIKAGEAARPAKP